MLTVVSHIEMQQDEDAGADANKWSGKFFSRAVCPECGGNRLNKTSLHFFIDAIRWKVHPIYKER